MTILTVATAARKGGVGKTTIVVGCAALFAHQQLRTLVVDLDPQSNAAFALGVDPSAPGTAELLLGRSPEIRYAAANLGVLPGGPMLTDHAVASLDPEELADAIKPLGFDVVIFDCPPGSDHLERFGLVAADLAMVVVDAHPFAITGAARVIDFIHARRLKQRRAPQAIAMVQSRLDPRRALDRDLEPALLAAYPDIPLHRVRQDIALAMATSDQRPIHPDQNSRGIQDLTTLTRWLYEQRRTSS